MKKNPVFKFTFKKLESEKKDMDIQPDHTDSSDHADSHFRIHLISIAYVQRKRQDRQTVFYIFYVNIGSMSFAIR